MIASVAIAIPYANLFDYSIPDGWERQVQPGMRILVPLNRRRVIGVVVGIKEKSEFERLKTIDVVIDASPLYSRRLLAITRWISEYYLCTWGEVLESAIPTGLRPKIEKTYEVNANHPRFRCFSKEEQRWLLQLNDLTDAKATKLSHYKEHASVWKKAKKEHLAVLKYRVVQKGENVHLVEVYSVRSDFERFITPRKGSKTYHLIEYLRNNPKRSRNQIASDYPNLVSAIPGLVKKKVLFKEWLSPIPLEDSSRIFHENFLQLNDQQEKAGMEICRSIRGRGFKAFLLFGVTGSGKTEIYLHAVRETIQKGRSALILVPEISLTPQAVSRLKNRFGKQIAVLHSGMAESARCREWWKIKSGLCPIVIGARSAIFAPLQNLGLIVVDEEHDTSYKQQETPYYHARDTAVKIGAEEKAVVVLGSATPSVESFYNCQIGKYTLLTLSQRVNQKPLPSVESIDLRTKSRQPGIFYLSDYLVKRLRENYRDGKQALIFLNRRGFASFIACTNCSAAVLCRNCTIAMTWHQKSQKLICHHCGFSFGFPNQCSFCHGEKFKLEGIGTQRVERDLQILFPKGRFLRMDRDSIAKKGTLEKNVQLISDRKVDFVVGTQLVSKGHDFKNIGLVCIILADMSLNIPDFRSSERSFQLISQVTGRAGRDADGKGRAFIQSYNPFHYAVVSASGHDYMSFYRQEIEMRADLSNPPFTHLLIIRLSESSPLNVAISAKTLGEKLRDESVGTQFQVLGPVESPIQKVNNRYYWQILIKSNRMGLVKKILYRMLWGKKQWKPKGKTRISVDIDPFVMV